MRTTFGDAERQAAVQLMRLALSEDLGSAGDLTSQALMDAGESGAVQIVCRAPGVVAGLPIVDLVFAELDPHIGIRRLVEDGTAVSRGDVVAELRGSVRSLLTGERTALNFLTHLSGVASLTQQYVAAVAGTSARIYDTRKTLPGWRVLQKYAVRAGGGANHRMGLYDMVLIKDNHLAGWQVAHPGGTVAEAVQAARQKISPEVRIQVEVDTLAQLQEALEGPPDLVLLDNMPPTMLQEAVRLRDGVAPQVELEASGGVSLSTVAAIARAGVERISVGALTHSAVALDLAFDWA